jgi:hypothetical protein
MQSRDDRVAMKSLRVKKKKRGNTAPAITKKG